MKQRHFLLILIAVVLAQGCLMNGSVQATPEDARWAAERWPGTTSQDLEEGRKLFAARCPMCHELPAIERKNPEQWGETIRGEMGSRARLSMKDRDLVARYLGARSASLRHMGG